MILSEKAGIITNYSEGKTKAGKKMIVISHTVGNSENLQKIFIFENDENFDGLTVVGKDLIGAKISTKVEIHQ